MNLTKLNQNGIPASPKDAVAFWDLMAAQFARGSVASQIMCGFALMELKEEMGVKPGNQAQVQLPKTFGNWPDFIQKTYGFSDDTALNRIKMAEGVKAKFKKLGLSERFKELLQTHPSEWSDTDTKLISDALHKVTDGMTQTDFLRQLDIAKKPAGNPNGNPKGNPKKLTDEENELLDPLLEVENELVSFSSENDVTFGDCNSVRLARFKRVLRVCLDRVQNIINARKKS